MIHFLVPQGEDGSIREYLEVRGAGLAGRMAIHHYEDLAAATSVAPGTYVLSALDHLAPPVTNLVGELCDELVRARPAVRVLNSPSATLLRFELLEELHRCGLNQFRAVRALGDRRGLRFPVFLREEHRHWGALTPLLHTSAELEAGLRRVIGRGHRLNDLLVVEFCDTADPDGLYRKYAAFAVGSAILPRHLSRGRQWMMKFDRSDFTRSLLLEEQAYVLENPHEHELRRIFAIARVEYGRIDYALKDGAIQTWEINLNPVIGRGRRPPSSRIPEDLRPMKEMTNEHFYRRFQAAFEAVDGDGADAPPIRVSYRPKTLRRARAVARRVRARSRWSVLRARLEPLRRLRDLILARLSPTLLRGRPG